MNATELPSIVDVNKLCQQSTQLQGQMCLSDFKRLEGLIKSPFNDLEFELLFSIDKQGLPNIQGRISAEIHLTCERCLQAMLLPFSHEFSLTPVKTVEEAKKLANHLDSIIIEKNGHLELQLLLEDEIILNLPLVPRHDPSACSVKLAPASAKKNERKKPFEGLVSLMNLEE